MTRRLISFLCAVAVLCICMAAPVSASETGTEWVELLETTTVNSSGSNLIAHTGTSTIFRIATPQYMRCTKVDMIFVHPSGYAPTSVRVRYNNIYYTLTLQQVDEYTTRAYGTNIPDNLYADLVIQVNKSKSDLVNYQLISCKVSAVNAASYSATAYASVDGSKIDVPFAYEGGDDSIVGFGHYQFPVVVTDWQKYDKLVISGSVGSMALNSVRVTVNGLGLPYEISYAVSNSTGSEGTYVAWNELEYYSYNESYQGTTEGYTFVYDDYYGKTLFTITIDLSGVDRTVTDSLYCYFTTLANPSHGYTIQIMGVMGDIDVADTSQASWWDKIKTFLTGLFDGDGTDPGDFEGEAEQQGSEMDDLNNELQSVTKPPVEDIQTDIGDYVSSDDQTITNDALAYVTGNSLVTSILMIVLTIALLGYILYGKR